MKRVIRVYHSEYGCESGCCGHRIEIDGDDNCFDFSHPPYDASDDQLKAWARELIEEKLGSEHAFDLDWENSDVTANC